MIKNINEDNELTELSKELQDALKDEFLAIEQYEQILRNPYISDSDKLIIKEILDDEKDHSVLISELLKDQVSDDLPDYGDDDSNSALEVLDDIYDQQE